VPPFFCGGKAEQAVRVGAFQVNETHLNICVTRSGQATGLFPNQGG
jgi:hypothetical protein